MEGDTLRKVNQALNTIAEAQNMDRSDTVLHQVESARALPHEEQVKLYIAVGKGITEKITNILERYPDGEVDCDLGTYKIDVDGSSLIVNHRQRVDFVERAFGEEGISEATEGEFGIVDLVPRIWKGERIESSWPALFDAQETIEAIHQAASVEQM
jgi:hypothetical protein